MQSSTTVEGAQFIAAVDEVLVAEDELPQRVAFDCEGVNLSRIGSVEVVSIWFPSTEVFLVDLGGTTVDPDILRALQSLFESKIVTKVIHDCRMDCDALFHLHGIRLVNIHDTSCFHHAITGHEDKNLNYVLEYNNVAVNVSRDNSVYRSNPRFWATRPMTQKMIDWASSDVDKLIPLAEKQLECISVNKKAIAIQKSTAFASEARDMKVARGLKVQNTGSFIGRGGSNIRSLQKLTGTIIYSEKPLNSWFVYYNSDDALSSVKRKMSSGSSYAYGY